MATRALIFSAAVSVALLGCAAGTFHLDGGGPVRNATPKACPEDGHGNCKVQILSPYCPWLGKCTASVEFDPINLERGKYDVNIVWTLPSGYGFCPGVGDGVFLKAVDNDNQFEDMYSTDLPDGAKPTGKKTCQQLKHYHWKALNTKPKPTDPYKYKILFHDDSGQKLYVIDPWVVNN